MWVRRRGILIVEMRTLFRWVELPSATLPGHYLLRMNWGKLAMRSPTHLPMCEVLGRKMAMFHVKHRHFCLFFYCTDALRVSPSCLRLALVSPFWAGPDTTEPSEMLKTDLWFVQITVSPSTLVMRDPWCGHAEE